MQLPVSPTLNLGRKRLVIPALALVAFAGTPVLPASAQTPSADLATTMYTARNTPSTGVQFFRAAVTNDGPGTSDNVVVTVPTPYRGSFYCVSGTAQACGSPPTGVKCTRPTGAAPTTCTTAALATGQTMTIWVGFAHGFLLPGQGFCATGNAISSTFDPNLANNTATACARAI